MTPTLHDPQHDDARDRGAERRTRTVAWIVGVAIAGLLVFLLWPRPDMNQVVGSGAEETAVVDADTRLSYDGQVLRPYGEQAIVLSDADMRPIGRATNGVALYAPSRNDEPGGGGGISNSGDRLRPGLLYVRVGPNRYHPVSIEPTPAR